ncbi:phage terminase large subunit family protein [Clostridium beijerinckii]|uniref:Terminase n=1 Tax=Clostridium beijerinckii TaxID=1520 RepID=A0A7X9XNJ8_CLOBE|nr:terminase [Clostridium beijerinckii]NMF04562.1 terminase [Clostridium beijerinckii]
MIYFDRLEFKDELRFEIYILKKHLTKHYGEEKAIALIQNNADDLDRLAKALGEIDIAFFCLYFMSDTFVVKDGNIARELAPAHYELWELADDAFIKDLYDKLNIIEPRGFAKTTIFDLAISVWLHCYRKSIFTLLGAKKDDDAGQFIDSIKKVFLENEKIKRAFGILIDPKGAKPSGERYTVNANEIEFTNDTYLRAVGSASSVRGANWKGIRPTVVIADDYQDEKDILTEDAREKKYNRWTKEIEQVGDKAVYRKGVKIKSATKIISIGTVLHIDCLMSRLSRNNDYKTILRRAIILEPNQTVEDIFESPLWLECKKLYFNDKLDNPKEAAKQFYQDHKEEMKFKTLWEEKWDCFNDLAVPYWENRISFMSELMNDATAIGEKWFKSVATRPSKDIEEHQFIKTMLIVDPASTQTRRSDFTFIGVGSESTNGFVYLRDYLMKRLTFDQYCGKVIEYLERYPDDITHIKIEKNTFQGADVLEIKKLISKHDVLKFKQYEFINEMQRKNKDEKISTIIDDVNNGQIILNSDCEDCKEVVDQIKEFQGQQYTPHDDAIDAISELRISIKEIEVISTVQILDRRSFGL